MKILKLLILLTAVYNCNGDLHALGDFLAGAHARIHSKVQDVAGAILGSIPTGFNINFGIGTQSRPQTPPPQPEDTVVVVIKEEENKYRPPSDANYQRPYRPPYGNDENGPINNNYNQRPNYNQYGQGNEQPNYGNPNNHYNHYNRPDNHYDGNYQRPDNTRPNYNYNQGNTNTEYVTNAPPPQNPTTEPLREETTKKSTDDEPFFVPLGPNEYNYGGEKINITSPKRDAEREAIENGDYNLDVRFKD